MTRRRTLPAVAFLLIAHCTRVSPDLALAVRQTAWPDSRAIEVAVDERQLNVTASVRRVVTDRRTIAITREQSQDLRRQFWRAWQHQPATRHTPRLMDGVLVEQVWSGPERTWQVGTKGPLTSYERDALRSLNQYLPEQYRFSLELGYR
jgi:hypothetical protein